MLTIEQVEKALPANLKGAATQPFVDQINNIVADPLVAEQIRNNFLSYSRVLQDGRFKTEDYLNAVVYVSYKLMGYSNQDAYFRTFPARHQSLLAKGTSSKDIAAYVAAYNRGKLVNLILEQSMVPIYVLNQHVQQDAINVLVELMQYANSEKVRSDSANALLTHLKVPEVAKVQLSVDVQDNSGLNELKESMAKLAQTQLSLIESGISPKTIAATPLIEGEAKTV